MSGTVNWEVGHVRKVISDLLRPGLLGFYDRLSVYEVHGAPKGQPPLNVLTVVVLEDQSGASEEQAPTILNGDRIRVEGFPNWTFGIARTIRDSKRLDEALATFLEKGIWAISGKPLQMGALEVVPPMFVPPNGSVDVPINNLLKNNFWNGSHVIRLCDPIKTALKPFLEDRRRLQSLSTAISSHMPVALAGMADFLGDVLIQIPVARGIVNVMAPKNGSHMQITVAWKDPSNPRNLRAAARMRSDVALTGAAITESFTHTATLKVASHADPVEAEIWDEETGVLFAATAPTSTISQIMVNLNLEELEPRVFAPRDATGNKVSAEIFLFRPHPFSVGATRDTSADQWRLRRSSLEEARRLEESRDFIQYKPKAGDNVERERALSDIRFLINKYGHGGIDIWDPYLTAEDILQTLFWCPVADVRLRGITDGREPPKAAMPVSSATIRQVRGQQKKTKCSICARANSRGQRRISSIRQSRGRPILKPQKTFSELQREVLARDAGNRRGLRLEYRTRFGPKGWAFHDRFLIFPNLPEGPAAWSLGTSVNSLGTAHHILQRVSNAALVSGAFEDLWTELNEARHLVWRSW